MTDILRTPDEMHAWSLATHQRGERIALVPTMGYLHDGHMALVRLAQQHADRVVISIFVNPSQFGPNEDLDKYPRDFAGDMQQLQAVGADIVFAPDAGLLYPPGFDTYVVPTALASGLCGASRPGHFRGVCTVVLLLLHITQCHVAVFGQKDFQQLQIIKRMVRDLWVSTTIIALPTVREADGLAKSSRNAYLSPLQRTQALVLSRLLTDLQGRVAAGERRVDLLLAHAHSLLGREPAVRLDYLSIVDTVSLQPLVTIDRPAVCAVAAFVGKTRLIDNVLLAGP